MKKTTIKSNHYNYTKSQNFTQQTKLLINIILKYNEHKTLPQINVTTTNLPYKQTLKIKLLTSFHYFL